MNVFDLCSLAVMVMSLDERSGMKGLNQFNNPRSCWTPLTDFGLNISGGTAVRVRSGRIPSLVTTWPRNGIEVLKRHDFLKFTEMFEPLVISKTISGVSHVVYCLLKRL